MVSHGRASIPQPPYSADLLADLHADNVAPDVAAQLWPLVRKDPDAQAILAALDRVTEELRAMRYDAPPIPDDVASFLDRVLEVPGAKPAQVLQLPRRSPLAADLTAVETFPPTAGAGANGRHHAAESSPAPGGDADPEDADASRTPLVSPDATSAPQPDITVPHTSHAATPLATPDAAPTADLRHRPTAPRKTSGTAPSAEPQMPGENVVLLSSYRKRRGWLLAGGAVAAAAAVVAVAFTWQPTTEGTPVAAPPTSAAGPQHLDASLPASDLLAVMGTNAVDDDWSREVRAAANDTLTDAANPKATTPRR